VSQAAIHQKNAQTGTGEIGAQDQAMVSGTDNDAVIFLIERFGQRSNSSNYISCGLEQGRAG